MLSDYDKKIKPVRPATATRLRIEDGNTAQHVIASPEVQAAIHSMATVATTIAADKPLLEAWTWRTDTGRYVEAHFQSANKKLVKLVGIFMPSGSIQILVNEVIG